MASYFYNAAIYGTLLNQMTPIKPDYISLSFLFFIEDHLEKHHCSTEAIIHSYCLARQSESVPGRGSRLSATKCDYSVYFPAVCSLGICVSNQLEIIGSTG